MNDIKQKQITIVAPLDINLISKLGNRRIGLRIKKLEEIEDLKEKLRNIKFELGEIILETDLPISKLCFSEKVLEFPISVYSEQFGDYLEFSKHIKTYRSSRIKLLLSSGIQDNYKHVKIMSSLGIKSGIYFTDTVFWDELTDLLTYSTYTKTNHQKIEPFAYIQNHYEKGENLDFNVAYQDSSFQYVHINKNEEIALSKEALKNGSFVFKGVENLTEEKQEQIQAEYTEKLQDFFINREMCSFCKAWKLCLGKFIPECNTGDKPKEFFDEVFEAVLFHQNELK